MMGAKVAAVLALLVVSQSAFPCAVCFGDPESDQSRALVISMSVLLALIVGILAAIVVTAARIARRAARLEAEAVPDGVEA